MMFTQVRALSMEVIPYFMLDYASEEIDGMDDYAREEQGQDSPFTGRWTTTSSYDVYMVDTPKEGDRGSPGLRGPRASGLLAMGRTDGL